MRRFYVIYCALMLSLLHPGSVESVGSEDRLVVIREGFRDGLNDTVRQEADLYLKENTASAAAAEVHLILAFLDLKSNNSKSAKFHLESALKGESSISSRAAYELGRLSWTAGDYIAASDHFAKAASDSSDSKIKAEALYWCGRALFMAGDCAKATAVFETATVDFGHERRTHVRYMTARCLYDAKNYPVARGHLTELIQSADLPNDWGVDALTMLAFIDYSDQKLDLAARWIECAIRMKADPQSFLFRIQLAIEAKDWQCALTWCRLAKKHFDAKSDAQLGEILKLEALVSSRFLDSLSRPDWPAPLIVRLEESDPTETVTLLNELLTAHHTPLAPETAQFAAELRSYDPETSGLHVAELHRRAGNADSALHWILRNLQARGIARPDPAMESLMIQLLAMSGDADSAAAMLHSVSETENPSASPDQQLEQVHITFRRGDFIRAIAEYQTWLVVNPDSDRSEEAAFWLGEACMRAEDLPNTVTAFERVLDRSTGYSKYSGSALYKLIECFVKQENWAGIVERVQESKELTEAHPRRAEILFFLGYAEARLGHFENALTHLGQSIDAHPDEAIVTQAKDLIIRIRTEINGNGADS